MSSINRCAEDFQAKFWGISCSSESDSKEEKYRELGRRFDALSQYDVKSCLSYFV